MLLEILIENLAPSIAKLILRRWLAKDIADELSGTLGSMIGKATTNIISRQRAERQFAAIGEEVALEIHPLFEVEGVKLSEESREAVAIAVANTLSKARISTKVLAQADLNPVLLRQLLLSKGERMKLHFSEVEYQLYEQIISDCSEHIIDISSQLPSFNEKTLGEILQRETELLELSRIILSEFQALKNDYEKNSTRFELEYLRAVKRKLDNLELFGVSVSRASRLHSLNLAYISLYVHQKLKTADLVTVDMELPINKALGRSKRHLIRGEAGSGKTTLLQWLVVRSASAREAFVDDLRAWNGLIPIFLQLRYMESESLQNIEDFPRLVTPFIVGQKPKDWVYGLLDSGRALVLIDGVDEVDISKREYVRSWIEDLVASFPSSFYVVTSRPSDDIKDDWLEHIGFVHSFLRPMTRENIFSFIDHWHESVKAELQSHELGAEINEYGVALKQVIVENRNIAELATNPLLCAMLCALHRDQRQKLPSDRLHLYEDCILMLVEKRNVASGVHLDEYPKLSYIEKISLLQDLAYWMISNGWTLVDKSNLLGELSQKLESMPNIRNKESPADILRLLIERTGIIREPSLGKIDFIHRTFQEYLAACAVLGAGKLDVLVNNAHQWKEMVVLAVAKANDLDRKQLITGILSRGEQEPNHKHQLYLLAAQCREAAINLSSAETKLIESHFSEVIPPRKSEEAIILSKSGETVISFLHREASFNEVEAATCIETLCLIAKNSEPDVCERIFRVLLGYAIDGRPEVALQLLRARSLFTPEIFEAELLTKCVSPEYINLASHDTITGLRFLTGLKKLYAHSNSSLINLEELTSLQELKELDLTNCIALEDISALKGLTRLEVLRLHKCIRIADFAPLMYQTSLKSLDVGQTNLGEIHYLRNALSLHELSIDGCKNMGTLRGIEDIHSLRTLSFINVNTSMLAKLDLAPLTNLPKLRKLDLSYHQSIVSLRVLSKISHLGSLILKDCQGDDVSKNGCTDFSFLGQLINLEELDLDQCKWIDEFTSLTRLQKLKNLSITLETILNGQLAFQKSINFLEGLINLRTLTLRGCKSIIDIAPLVGLSQLENLYLFDCSSLRSLNELKYLQRLKSLTLENCSSIGDFSILDKLPNLTNVEITGSSNRAKLSTKFQQKRESVGKIFISYSHQDEAAVNRLKDALLKSSYEVWEDRPSIEPWGSINKIASKDIRLDRFTDSKTDLQNLLKLPPKIPTPNKNPTKTSSRQRKRKKK